MSNRGRHKKKKDNKIHPKITVYDSTLNCYVTFYIKNNKLEYSICQTEGDIKNQINI